MIGKSGFTLVELMIVIAMMALLIMAVAPLTTAWVNDADLLKVEGDLTQAVGRAKAAALRNEGAAINDQPASAICISTTNLLTLLERSSAAAPNCTAGTGNQTWSTQLAPSVAVSANNLAVTCMCFDNKGLPTSNACSGCNNSPTLNLSTGNNSSESVQIF